jgi:hypothetical protein
MMQSGDQEPGRDANRFRDIVILALLPFIQAAAPLREDRD